ncbi:1-(5-phosphoribosyl)-5-[(5-phosphoribosylamino)methylideneamino]imidazole-4-carboxamide isomerase [Listeria sp. ILCC792]|uniref:1-(5-phosphoribosyl)-5-[(5- phosphoribosylamino)methylideneamino]imidazole-4- carboxamide isomerase n=1 Tax=Listeria sp. ILCC792 TaxID=1918331 RepID=UPI000B587D80|nr:1-(5-phosphoribosyl)-5-[(5-phosphoribosylamino)methylideneamino]imidazole-4-carboxamide isomerase [Listeria sp. ILCC792]
MRVYPAIDIKNGKCVRLYQGNFDKETIVNPNPVAQALAFQKSGASYLHIVDLDGALNGDPANLALIQEMSEQTGLPVQVGGGIRSMQQVAAYLESGIARVIIGSSAVSSPEFVREAVTKYGERIAVGIDAKNGFVATDGWLNTSDIRFTDFAVQMEKLGVATLIFTDIGRDGTLAGPNFEQLAALQNAVSCAIIASGGVKNQADLIALKKQNLAGAIAGKALYSESLTMKEILEVEN